MANATVFQSTNRHDPFFLAAVGEITQDPMGFSLSSWFLVVDGIGGWKARKSARVAPCPCLEPVSESGQNDKAQAAALLAAKDEEIAALKRALAAAEAGAQVRMTS